MSDDATYRAMKQQRDAALAECERLRADLRDKFAGLAMQMKFGDAGTHISKELHAGFCYQMADAMLAARGKP